MRLLEINLKNYRVHRDTTVKFSPAIHVVGGRNEIGKSTIAEAIHRVLFLKADGTTEYHKKMKSTFGGEPEIRLRFEQGGTTYVLFKRFVKNQVTKFGIEGKAEYSDAQADAELTNVIHAQTGLGKSGLTTQWAHLWAWQEQSMDNPLSDERYPHQALILQVQKLGGGAAVQSKKDQQVAEKLIARRDALFTTRGLKADSPAAKASDLVEKYGSDATEARKVLEEIEVSLEQIRASEENIASEKASQLNLQNELEKHAAEMIEIEKAEKVLSEISRHIVAAAASLRTLKESQSKIDQQLASIEIAKQELAEARKELAPLAQTSADAKADAATCRLASDAAYGERDNLQKSATLVQQAIDRIELLERKLAAEAELTQAQSADILIEKLQKELSAIPQITRQDITALAKLGDVASNAQAALEAMGVSVTVQRAGRKVSLDGTEVLEGQSKVVTDASVIRVGDDVTLSLSPKNGDIASQRKTLEQARQKFAEALKKFGVDSLYAAETNLSARDDLQGKIERAETSRGTSSATDLRKTLSDLENELIQLDAKHPESKQASLGDKAAKSAEKKRLSPLVRDAVANAETKGALREASEKKASKAIAGESALSNSVEKLGAELNDLENQLTGMLSSTGSLDKLKAEILRAENERQALDAKLTASQAEIYKLTPDLVRASIKMKQNSLEKSSTRINEAEKLSNTHRGIVKGRTSGDPKLTLATAVAKLESAQADYTRENALAEALKLLADMFESTQAELNKAFTGPLVSKIDEYAKILFGHEASIEMVDNNGTFTEPVLIRPQRGLNSTTSFDKLSGGAKEQFSAAIRLAMAEVLSKSHDGHLPVIFDDTFSYTDTENLNKVHLLLNHASEKGLQVILFTHAPDEFKPMGADVTIL
jgi:DNA repair exonuclease SbcCD ATPase subunit